jgi:hypothetical protein
MENKDLPAYPNVEISETGETCTHSDYRGLSKRELIAAMCLQGLLANSSLDNTPAWFSDIAIQQADNLLNQLQNTEQ